MRRSIPALLLIALGLAAQIAAMFALAAVDPLLEYAAPAPLAQAGEDGQDAAMLERIQAVEDAEVQLGADVAALSMSALKSGADVSGAGQTVSVMLQCVGARWLETCPREPAEGRWLDGAELKRGAKVAVLDEDLAFALFGSESALGREVTIEGVKYAVTGTVRHSRRPGEANEYSAYIPLNAAVREGLQTDVTVAHALGNAASGLGQSFSQVMSTAWGAGETHDLRKERMGALLLTRLLFCAFGLVLVIRLTRRFSALTRRWLGQIAEHRRHSYVFRWLWGALARWLGIVLGAAALLAVVYGILSVAIEPVYSFTEWVPESLVSVSAVRAVFWSRAADAARMIRVATPDSARIAFWGALDRVGAVMLLLGLALGHGRRARHLQAEPAATCCRGEVTDF